MDRAARQAAGKGAGAADAGEGGVHRAGEAGLQGVGGLAAALPHRWPGLRPEGVFAHHGKVFKREVHAREASAELAALAHIRAAGREAFEEGDDHRRAAFEVRSAAPSRPMTG